MTLCELKVLLVWLALAVAGGRMAGLVGFVVGIGGPILIGILLSKLEAWRFPELPPCRNGSCRGLDYRLQALFPAGYAWTCRCGDGYLLCRPTGLGPRRLRRLLSPAELEMTRGARGDSVPFKVHRQFGAWKPDVEDGSPDR